MMTETISIVLEAQLNVSPGIQGPGYACTATVPGEWNAPRRQLVWPAAVCSLPPCTFPNCLRGLQEEDEEAVQGVVDVTVRTEHTSRTAARISLLPANGSVASFSVSPMTVAAQLGNRDSQCRWLLCCLQRDTCMLPWKGCSSVVNN